MLRQTAMLIPLVITLSVAAAFAGRLPPLIVQDGYSSSHAPEYDVKVPIILGVMSKCPDALLCETVFDKVLHRVSSKVDVHLTYVGRINVSEPDFGVTCKHGPGECAGNIQQLCVAKYATPTQWWDFVQCQNFQGGSKIGLPETALNCASSVGLDWELSGVGECAGLDGSGKSKEGVRLLHASVKTTAELGITTSCTILINYKQVCIRDGTWKECENGHSPSDFIKQINDEYERLNADN